MKIITLPSSDEIIYEAYLQDDRVFIYKDNVCEDILTIQNIESSFDPIPLVVSEIELLSKPSLYDSIGMFN